MQSNAFFEMHYFEQQFILYEIQPYFSNKNVHQARTMFRFYSGMFPCKLNFRSNENFSRSLFKCHECQSEVDSMSHVAICPAYQPLREGKDLNSDKDLAEYMSAVMSIRTRQNLVQC